MNAGRQSRILALLLTLGVATSPVLAQTSNARSDKQVQRIFQVAMKGICESLDPASILYPPTPEIFEISGGGENEDYPEGPYRLYAFPCTAGAYNFGSIFYVADDFGEIRQAQFATPEFDVTNETDDFESAVTGIELTGFYAYDIIISPDFDPQTNTLESFSKWRGLADASSSGQWVFKRGRFVLKSYDVDASYDGEMNPVRIYGEGNPSYH
jgi:uncharacterized protein DUF1176